MMIPLNADELAGVRGEGLWDTLADIGKAAVIGCAVGVLAGASAPGGLMFYFSPFGAQIIGGNCLIGAAGGIVGSLWA
jgi:hypothetical protein